MKKLLFSFCLLIGSLTLSAQNDFIDEDFNTSSLPSGWSNLAVSGVLNWQFGYISSPVSTANFNIDGSKLAYFDDEALGSLGTNNTVELKTPFFNNSTATATFLSFDYFFRSKQNRADSFYVEVFDGFSWYTIFSQTFSTCAGYNTRCPLGSYPSENIDISAYQNINCQVRFTYHDANGLSYYMGIDNVKVYEPISTTIEEIEKNQTFIISPNPNNGNFNLNITNEMVGKQYQVFDITGSLIKQARIDAPISQIELSNIEKGVYFIQIDGYTKPKRIIIF